MKEQVLYYLVMMNWRLEVVVSRRRLSPCVHDDQPSTSTYLLSIETSAAQQEDEWWCEDWTHPTGCLLRVIPGSKSQQSDNRIDI